MSNVIFFPTPEIRNWLEIEKPIRKFCRHEQVSEEFEKRIVGRMREFYEILQQSPSFTFPIEIPASNDLVSTICNDIGRTVGSHLQRFLDSLRAQLLVDRMTVEIDLCRALGL